MDIVGIEDDISTYFFEPFNLNPELGILHFTRYRVILKKLLKEMCDFLFYEHFLTNVCTLGEIGLLNLYLYLYLYISTKGKKNKHDIL